jgi:hypothetical protein
MNVKILKICLIVFASFLISGCTKTIYVDRVTKVNVPVPCTVPEVKCEFDKPTYTEVISELVRCIEEHKAAAAVCKE